MCWPRLSVVNAAHGRANTGQNAAQIGCPRASTPPFATRCRHVADRGDSFMTQFEHLGSGEIETMTSSLRTDTCCCRRCCRFPNRLSSADLLTCDDASCLTPCLRAFVSLSCHFCRTCRTARDDTCSRGLSSGNRSSRVSSRDSTIKTPAQPRRAGIRLRRKLISTCEPCRGNYPSLRQSAGRAGLDRPHR
jgi:hypothetical protein